MQRFSASPREITSSLARHRALLSQLIKREILGRYRGSVMGLLWSVLNPLLLLTVYTFVFSIVFKARWGGDESLSHLDFALNVFTGMIFFNMFAECFGRAPTLILHHATYVTKVVFPLEILPWMVLGSALFHFLVGFAILLAFTFCLHGSIPPTLLLLPLLLLPFCLLLMGLLWFLAALGVYLRDIGQLTGLITTVLMFLSPIFYPVTSLPGPYRILFLLNPMTFIIEQARALMGGDLLMWQPFEIYTACSALFCWVGFAWFQKTRKGFADVL